ncbi:MAG: hypothetical protein KDC82_02950 [Bacteroidetes bacterium]|nr:hypothetical protein [Bacteroidota bacterium]
MEWLAVIRAALEALLPGLEMLKEHQRTRFKREYHELLENVDKWQNMPKKDWNDARLGAAKLELMRFFEAYSSEIRTAGVENMRQGEGRSGEKS